MSHPIWDTVVRDDGGNGCARDAIDTSDTEKV
jgi:hypothetical protein